MEKWVDIIGYEGIYEVSDMGRVKNLDHVRMPQGAFHKGKILKPHPDKDGYLRIGLTKNKKRTTYSIHRLVALNFINNEFGYPQVNHIDGVVTNNNVENLEWVNQSQNTIHAIDLGLIKIRKSMIFVNEDTGDMIYFESQTEASQYIGKNDAYISHALARGQSHYENFRLECVGNDY